MFFELIILIRFVICKISLTFFINHCLISLIFQLNKMSTLTNYIHDLLNVNCHSKFTSKNDFLKYRVISFVSIMTNRTK